VEKKQEEIVVLVNEVKGDASDLAQLRLGTWSKTFLERELKVGTDIALDEAKDLQMITLLI
jgi:hypothetical protein